MSWRTVVVTGNAKLEYKLDYLVIRKIDSTCRIHLSEVGLLIIESTAVSLTTMLLSELSKKKVKVIFCDEKHNPQSELCSYYGAHDTSLKISNQVEWSTNAKTLIWTQIIKDKINKQAIHLSANDYFERACMLYDYAANVELGDSTNREGHAAKVYFNTLFGLDFSRTQENAINAALDYGYGIILSVFNREIVSNGYITQLGLRHKNQFNQFNLSSDLMEPFRILVDRIVVAQMPEKFNKEMKYELIGILSDPVIIDGKTMVTMDAIKVYCKSVFAALSKEDPFLIKFYNYEL